MKADIRKKADQTGIRRTRNADRKPMPEPSKREPHRPTLYDDDMPQRLLDYFDKISYTTDPKTKRRTPLDLPTVAGFAAHIGTGKDTIYAWARQYKIFSDALKMARAKMENMLTTNALLGNYERVNSIFALKNLCGWRDDPQVVDEQVEGAEWAKYTEYKIFRRLFDRQAEVYNSKRKDKRMCCGRRSGKSEEIAHEATVSAAVNGGRVVYIGLTSAKAKANLLPIIDKICRDEGIPYNVVHSEYKVKFPSGGEIIFCGNGSADEREKLRGFASDLNVVDECQSQKELRYLLDDILRPTTMDRMGALILAGTPSRVRGTYWEELFHADNDYIFRRAWNMRDNPYIPDVETQLQQVREEHGWTEQDPTYQREFLGIWAYDDEALVLRFTDKNYYVNDEFRAWIETVNANTIRCTIGADLGYEDADALAVICYSTQSKDKWLIHECVIARQGIQQFIDAARHAIEIASQYTSQQVRVYYDSGGLGKKIGEDLYHNHALPFYPAEKQGKAASVLAVQEDVQRGAIHVQRGGNLDKDSSKIVFERTEKLMLTSLIDDNAFHSDIFDAYLYAHRQVCYDTPRDGTWV